MKFSPTSIRGVVVVDTQPNRDQRGSFRRLWCRREADAASLFTEVVQTSLSITNRRYTLRGMHFQLAPSREAKLVHCVQGRIYDVALDLRRNSPTYLQHFGLELSSDGDLALLIPPGCAHGFLTLVEDCAVLYMMSDYYQPALSSGVRWNDPAFGIEWPAAPAEMIERDAKYPDFQPGSVDGFADY